VISSGRKPEMPMREPETKKIAPASKNDPFWIYSNWNFRSLLYHPIGRCARPLRGSKKILRQNGLKKGLGLYNAIFKGMVPPPFHQKTYLKIPQ
jgi:hypothetical protein